jgi:hypothetical protein
MVTWKGTMKVELDQLMERGTWELVQKPPDVRITKAHQEYLDIKEDEDDDILLDDENLEADMIKLVKLLSSLHFSGHN